jgi:putative endonuclease
LVNLDYFVYIISCADKSLYCGFTIDLKKRLIKHNEGKASKYTRSRLPVKMVYFERFSDKSRALRREYEIKQFSRKKKLLLIKKN